MRALFFANNIPIGRSKVLLFIDEIQESPEAISYLRYFYEQYPDLHVIAAGSLLEFALGEVKSFPVGRVEFYTLHPFDFQEFLWAKGMIEGADQLSNFPEASFTHETLLNTFHEYAMIGGMPEVIKEYRKHSDLVLLQEVYMNLWQSYKDDVEKYAKNSSEKKVIRHILETAAQEKDRIAFEKFGNSHYRSREVGEAIQALDIARIIHLLYPTTDVSLPMNTNFRKRPRLQFLDTGLLIHSLGVQSQFITMHDLNDLARGRFVQHLVTQQLIAIHSQPSFKPHFWVRESKDSNAEVDLVYPYGGHLIPIEIKSGKEGKLRSLHQFIDRCPHHYAMRLYAGKFSLEKAVTISGKNYMLLNLPYYLACKIPEYLDWFFRQR